MNVALVDGCNEFIETLTLMRWTCKSKDKLAAELVAMGHKVSATKVGLLLTDLGYSLQVVRKTREGDLNPENWACDSCTC